MKTILYTFIMSAVWVLLASSVEDHHYIDSLNREMNVSKNGIRKLLLETEIARLMSNEDSAVKILQTVLDSAVEMDEKHVELAANLGLGYVYMMDGTEPDNALQFLSHAEIMSVEMQDTLSLAQSREYQGEIWAIKSSPGNAAMLYDSAEQLLQTNSQIINSLPDKRYMGVLGQIYHEHALLFMLQEQWDSAQLFEKRAAAIFKQCGWNTDRAASLASLASIESRRNNHQQAIDLLIEAVDVCTLDDAPEISSDLSKLALEYSEAGNFKMARQKADSALLIAKNINAAKEKASAFSALATIEKRGKDYKEALNFYDSAMVLSEQIIAQQSNEKISPAQKKLQSRAEIISTEKEKAEIQRRSNIRFAGIAVFLITGLVFIIAFTRAKRIAWVAKVLGAVGLLLMFELISLIIHPALDKWTHHSAQYMLLILVLIGAVLVTFHHRIEDFVKRLVHAR